MSEDMSLPQPISDELVLSDLLPKNGSGGNAGGGCVSIDRENIDADLYSGAAAQARGLGVVWACCVTT